jgi:hypothetical protein
MGVRKASPNHQKNERNARTFLKERNQKTPLFEFLNQTQTQTERGRGRLTRRKQQSQAIIRDPI